MKVFNKCIYLAIVFFGLISCEKEESSDIDPDTPIYQDLKVEYNIVDSETKALATFRESDENGSRLILSNDASIYMNDNKIEYSSNITNYFYRTNFDSLIDVNFQFTKNNGDSFTNTISVDDRPDLVMTNSTDTVKLDGSSKVYWKSGELQNNESISFYVKQGRKSGGVGYHAKTGTNYIELSPIIIGSLSEGSAELHIGREKIIDELNQGAPSISNGRRVIETKIIHAIYLEN